MKKGQTYSDLNNTPREERIIKGFNKEFLFANHKLQWKIRGCFCALVNYGFEELELYLLSGITIKYLRIRIAKCKKC